MEDYLAQRAFLGEEFEGPTLHVLWAGLNDFVTAERPDPAREGVGAGAFPAVMETRSLIESIVSASPGTETEQYFMVVDLPNVYSGEPEIDRYNALLATLVANWPQEAGAPARDHVHLVTMSKWMEHVCHEPAAWQLSSGSQPTGVRPFYDAGTAPAPAPVQAPTPDRDPVPAEVRRCLTTSTPHHPTQAVHSLMARYFLATLLKNGHAMGRLDNDTCPLESPLSTLPLDIPTTCARKADHRGRLRSGQEPAGGAGLHRPPRPERRWSAC